MKIMYFILEKIFSVISSQVWALVRDNSEMILAPALQVFTGEGTGEENFYLAVILILGGLLVAVIWINLVVGLQKINTKILTKMFSLWIIFSLGVMAISISQVIIPSRQRLVTRADPLAQPQNITIKYEDKLVTVSWQTAKATVGYAVFYSEQDNPPQVVLSNHGQPTTQHQVMTAFEANETQVEMAIFSDGIEYRYYGERIKINLK